MNKDLTNRIKKFKHLEAGSLAGTAACALGAALGAPLILWGGSAAGILVYLFALDQRHAAEEDLAALEATRPSRLEQKIERLLQLEDLTGADAATSEQLAAGTAVLRRMNEERRTCLQLIERVFGRDSLTHGTFASAVENAACSCVDHLQAWTASIAAHKPDESELQQAASLLEDFSRLQKELLELDLADAKSQAALPADASLEELLKAMPAYRKNIEQR